MSLIKIDGKPLEKLIEVISNGIGTLYRPRAIKKEAESKAYEIGIIEEAKCKAIANGKQLEAETYIKIQERILFNEIERQKNIDAISEKTAERLENEHNISDESVDKDWTKRFFNIAQDISDDEMQNIWSRILAGEIVRPGSFSLRTLELIKNLSKQEAECFSRVANLTISTFSRPCIYNGNSNGDDFLNKFGCGFEDRLLLMELGLLQSETNISRSIPANNSENDLFLYYDSGNVILKHTIAPKSQIRKIPIYRYSKIGEELLKIIVIQPNIEYLKQFAKDNSDENSKFEYAHILNKEENGGFKHTFPWIEFE